MSDEEDKMNKEEIIEDEGENSASFRTQRYFISQLEENLKKNFQFFFSIGSFIDSSRALPKSTIDNEQIELFLAAGQLECSIKLIYETTFDVPLKPSSNICNEILFARLFLVCRLSANRDSHQLYFGVLGNVDSGKSTLVGVLTTNCLDNGRGQARQGVLQFPHEKNSGRTSSISVKKLSFDTNLEPVYDSLSGKNSKICCLKTFLFVDMAGHEKYLKTTITGISGYDMNGCFIVVGANAGGIGTFEEHLRLCINLNIPFAIVFTKIDMCDASICAENLRSVSQYLKSRLCLKKTLRIKNKKDVIAAAKSFADSKIVPIFEISNVTGENLDLLKFFLNCLPPKLNGQQIEEISQLPLIAEISEKFFVKNQRGPVVMVNVRQGMISANEECCIGPLKNGEYHVVEALSTWTNSADVKQLKTNQYGTICVRSSKHLFNTSKDKTNLILKKEMIYKGMHLIDIQFARQNPPSWIFEADIHILRHPSIIRKGYQIVVHIGFMKQTVVLLDILTVETSKAFPTNSSNAAETNAVINKASNLSTDDHQGAPKVLRIGDRGRVRFQFCSYSAFIMCGMSVLFRESKTKAVGKILSIEASPELNFSQLYHKYRRRKK